MAKLKLILITGLFLCYNIYADGMSNNELTPTDVIRYRSDYHRFMITENNNIVYVSTTKYLDINDMSINTLDLPETINSEKCIYLRPPFSNNKIMLNSNYDDNLFIYDILDKEATLINDVSYGSLFPDSDRNFVTFSLSSSEWWLGCLSRGYILWLIRKDGAPLRQSENDVYKFFAKNSKNEKIKGIYSNILKNIGNFSWHSKILCI
jgi:hypothetical protein